MKHKPAPRLVARVESMPAIVSLEAYFDTLLALAERAERAEILAAIRRDLENVSNAPAIVVDDTARRAHVERLVARGRDLVALAAFATGNELRTLLRPWVDSMTFDKQSRELTLTLRTLAAGLLPETLREKDSPEQTVRRRAIVGRKVSA